MALPHVGVLRDAQQCFLIGEPQLVLDDEGADDPAGINRPGAHIGRKALGVDLDHTVPG